MVEVYSEDESKLVYILIKTVDINKMNFICFSHRKNKKKNEFKIEYVFY